jgi:hypothetical protein
MVSGDARNPRKPLRERAFQTAVTGP